MDNNNLNYILCENILDKINTDDNPDLEDLVQYCKTLLSDSRLLAYPNSLELYHGHNININYYDDTNDTNELNIILRRSGSSFNDKVLSYFCINSDKCADKKNASWNEVIDIINKYFYK